MAGRLPWEKAIKALKATVIRDKLAGGVFGSEEDTVIRVAELDVAQDPVSHDPSRTLDWDRDRRWTTSGGR